MKISVILGHPNPKSFNHAIAQMAVATLKRSGHEVRFHDLHAEGFDPLLPAEEAARGAPLPAAIAAHCVELAEADGIIIVHPNWWGQPPAILKGWIDRVVRPGVAYEFVGDDKGEGVPRGLLKAKAALVFNTANTRVEREQKVFGDPLEAIWKNCVFDLCGVPRFFRRMFTIVVTSTDTQRQAWLADVERIVSDHFPKKV